MFNPALNTMPALCAASHLERIRRDLGGPAVSLGSFSEAEHLVQRAFLERVFGELSARIQGHMPTGPRLAWRQWFARDGSLFAALPRMAWALYGGDRAGEPNRAVRLHLNFHVLNDKPAQAQVTTGRTCERKSWEEEWEAGAGYIGEAWNRW